MSILINDSPEEVYEKNKHLLCTNPEEIINADQFMKAAVKHLVHHAKSNDDYISCKTNPNHHIDLYKKKHKGHTLIEKVKYTIDYPDKYNEIINMYWDPDYPRLINSGSVKITRVYNPNLVMIQHRYKKKLGRRQKYFYALATKVEISEDKTIIAISSANINDHNPSDKKYKNTIVKEANLFKTEIDSEDDIREGKLKKVFVNINGYLFKKRSKCVDITYIESIDGHNSICQDWIIGQIFNYFYLDI
ncbi:hypothetical protein [Plasmodium yoelii yoelii]|uniref:Fam-a protein n=1 Tax=Plasmodium yoelii yoelii TaxID=73239 RepID=Q7RG28_PLAYO|nr:hypothetical protein [Plasmodium yoelii yoelii]